jgi:hypothetical protein
MCPRRPFSVLNTKNVVVSDTPRLIYQRVFARRLTKNGSRDFCHILHQASRCSRRGLSGLQDSSLVTPLIVYSPSSTPLLHFTATTIHDVSFYPLSTNTARPRPSSPKDTMHSHPRSIPHTNNQTTPLLPFELRTTPHPAGPHNPPPPRSRTKSILQTPLLLRGSRFRLRHDSHPRHSNTNPTRSSPRTYLHLRLL